MNLKYNCNFIQVASFYVWETKIYLATCVACFALIRGFIPELPELGFENVAAIGVHDTEGTFSGGGITAIIGWEPLDVSP